MQETIAVIFDFDDTLAPDSTSGYLREAGIDVASFWKNEVHPLTDDDWDPVPAYLYKMIEKARQGKLQLTRDKLIEWGQRLPLHRDVETLFRRLRAVAEAANPTVAVEFYLISSGIGDVVRNTRIAHEFKDIWASEFHYGEDGNAVFMKKVVSFTDKTRYLFHIQKGLIGPRSRGKPLEVNKKLAPEQLRIPFSNMIFVGDGLTDIPCFSLVSREKGMAIAVYDKNHVEKWGNAFGFVKEGRVATLYSANYTPGSDLSNFLEMAVRNLAERIAVTRNAYRL